MSWHALLTLGLAASTVVLALLWRDAERVRWHEARRADDYMRRWVTSFTRPDDGGAP